MRLFASISANGLGHAVQVSHVVAALLRRGVALDLAIRSDVPAANLAELFPCPFLALPGPEDFGIVMAGPLAIDRAATRDACLRLDRDWAGEEARIAGQIAAFAPDLVLSDAGFLAVAAARRLGVTPVLLANLFWSDLLRAIFAGDGEIAALAARIDAAYGTAERVLSPEPTMPWGGAPALLRRVPPIAQTGRARRAELRTLLGLESATRIIIVAFGGLGAAPPVTAWPALPGIAVLSPGVEVPEQRLFDLRRIAMPFADLLASSDAFVGKTGYGTVVGAACHRLPLLYVDRPWWPEDPPLLAWMADRVLSRKVTTETLADGAAVHAALQDLWSREPPPAVTANGADIVADALLRLVAGDV